MLYLEFYDGDLFLGNRNGVIEEWVRENTYWTSLSRPDEVGTDEEILKIINANPDAWNNGIAVMRNDSLLDTVASTP